MQLTNLIDLLFLIQNSSRLNISAKMYKNDEKWEITWGKRGKIFKPFSCVIG